MGFIYALRSEQEKTKHTSFGAIHFCVPVMGALLFLAYYSQYASTADSKKLKMILEITTTFFPLLISVIVGLNVALEEKASHFQTLLAVPNRHKNMLAKLTYLYGSGVFALFFLFLLFVIGIHLLGMADTVQLGMLIGAAAGMAFCNFIIYILHLFLSFKFGLGLSLFWGVFESLQCILYSNIELKGVARYIPFAWSMNWVQDILSRQIFNYGTEKIWIAALTTGGLLLTLLWFPALGACAILKRTTKGGNNMAAILMIDDERAILELVKNGLRKDGHFVTAYTSAAQVPLDKLNRYDLIILDIMMPDVDGFSYCDKIRSLVDCPILFLTAKTMEHDITFGLGLGADDYLTKPFRIAELRARVNAHLRRERRERHTALTFDRIKIDLSAKELRVDNTPVALTKSEYLICEYLARNKGQVFSKEQIYETVFGLEGDSDNSTISTHIKNIRSKLNKLDIQPIETVWGIGYKWE